MGKPAKRMQRHIWSVAMAAAVLPSAVRLSRAS